MDYDFWCILSLFITFIIGLLVMIGDSQLYGTILMFSSLIPLFLFRIKYLPQKGDEHGK